jgi:CBS domain-containing protein
MEVHTCMKTKVITLHLANTLEQATLLFLKHHIGTLPVVDDAERLVGLLLLQDLLSLVMPDFIHLIEDFDYLLDFGALETRRPDREALSRPVSEFMQEAISVQASCGLLRAFAILKRHHLLDLPVVDENNRLVGIASRVDIGTRLLVDWCSGTQGEQA